MCLNLGGRHVGMMTGYRPSGDNSQSQSLVYFISVFAMTVASSEAAASEALRKKPCHFGTLQTVLLSFSGVLWPAGTDSENKRMIVSSCLSPSPLLHSALPLWESLFHELYS